MLRSARAVTALALLTLAVGASPAQAALVTDVATAADKDVPVQFNVDLRWRRIQHRAKITREEFDKTTSQTLDVTEMYYQRWTHIMDLKLALGIYHDLEIHGDIPYAIQDEQTWDYAHINGASVKPTSSLQNNPYNTDGSCLNADCTQTRPIVTSPGTVYRGGFMDPSIGFAWGIFNGKRDQKLPKDMFPFKQRTATWVVGFDYTMPIIQPMDPSKANPAAPDPNNPLSLGLGTHRFDWWMAMSKRIGMVDPFFRIHYTLPVAAENAYDNCSAASIDTDNHIMSTGGKKSCDPNGTFDPNHYWIGKTGLEYPHYGGMSVGTEFIPIEQPDDLRLAIVVQLSADFVSKGRTYTEMSDALQKLTYADQYFQAGAQLAFDLRLSKWVHWLSYVSLGTETPHFITSETVGKDRWGTVGDNCAAPGTAPDGKVCIGSAEVNPNYDFRLDQPGRRLMVTEVSNLVVSSDLSVNF